MNPTPWWQAHREALLDIGRAHREAYVYHLDTVRDRTERVVALEPVDRVFFAMKANSHPDVLRTVHAAGAGFECVSPGEIARADEAVPGLRADQRLFTPNFAPAADFAAAFESGATVTLDSSYPLEHWPDLLSGREVFLRLDPGWGSGHHDKVVTGGDLSKFGVPIGDLDEVLGLAADADVRVTGLHIHSGSGIDDPEHWATIGRALVERAANLPDVRVVNVGGGFHAPEQPGQSGPNWEGIAAGLAALGTRAAGLELWVEPGRALVAEAGVLIATVTQVKSKNGRRYIGLSTGMNSLLRPALYGAHHQIVNLTRLHEAPTGPAQIVGPICESGDVLGADRDMPTTTEGDVVLIATAGAYGRVMASSYNLREPAPEIVI